MPAGRSFFCFAHANSGPDLFHVMQNVPEKKIFYGWIITGIVFLNLAMAYGAQYSFGVFFPSLIEEFGWNRQSLSGAFSLYTFMYSTLGFFLGRLTDRLGPRLILIGGSVCLDRKSVV